MNRVLITGATGFVGRQVMKAMSGPEIKLVPVVRHGKECRVNSLPSVERVVTTDDLFEEDMAWWAQQCQGIDIIVHLAWYVEPGKYLQSTQNINCLIGSLNLAKGASIAGVKRIIGVGTCFEYDLTGGVLSVDTRLNPMTPYAASKTALFLNLSQWLPTQAIQFAWCRLFYLYGDGEDERRLVPYLHKRLAQGKPAALTSGTQVRDFLDVSEAGKKVAEIAQGNQIGPFNICSGTPVTVKQLAEQVADTYGRKDLLQFGARSDNLTDPPYIVGIPRK